MLDKIEDNKAILAETLNDETISEIVQSDKIDCVQKNDDKTELKNVEEAEEVSENTEILNDNIETEPCFTTVPRRLVIFDLIFGITWVILAQVYLVTTVAPHTDLCDTMLYILISLLGCMTILKSGLALKNNKNQKEKTAVELEKQHIIKRNRLGIITVLTSLIKIATVCVTWVSVSSSFYHRTVVNDMVTFSVLINVIFLILLAWSSLISVRGCTLFACRENSPKEFDFVVSELPYLEVPMNDGDSPQLIKVMPKGQQCDFDANKLHMMVQFVQEQLQQQNNKQQKNEEKTLTENEPKDTESSNNENVEK